MVQVVENRTDLEGVVKSQTPQATGVVVLVVAVERATPVPGVADLLSQRVGSSLDVTAPADRVPSDLTDQRIRFRARLAGPGVVRLDPAVPIARLP